VMFLERVVARVFMHVFDKVWLKVESEFKVRQDVDRIMRQEDRLKVELLGELDNAETSEEIDKILERIVDSSKRS